MQSRLRLATLAEARQEISRLAAATEVRSAGAWSPYQALIHCAQSIKYSATAFPRLKPALLRATVGRIVMRKFLLQGHMSHGLAAPIPGAPEIRREGDLQEAVERLMKSIDAFEAFRGEPAIHPVYDRVTKEQYARLHAMHLADHLSVIETA